MKKLLSSIFSTAFVVSVTALSSVPAQAATAKPTSFTPEVCIIVIDPGTGEAYLDCGPSCCSPTGPIWAAIPTMRDWLSTGGFGLGLPSPHLANNRW